MNLNDLTACDRFVLVFFRVLGRINEKALNQRLTNADRIVSRVRRGDAISGANVAQLSTNVHCHAQILVVDHVLLAPSL